jgi:hypothetical protein
MGGMMEWVRAFFSDAGTTGEGGFRAPRRIFWVGFGLRVLFMTLAHGYHVRPILDHFQFGWEVGRIARAVALGRGYADPFLGRSGPTAWIAPLYPLILAGVFKMFGVYTAASAWVILTVNSAFSAGTALAVYEIAARCFDAGGAGNPCGNDARRPTALWSAWLWALYPAAMQYAVHWIWDMSLTTFLLAWAIVLALRVRGVGECGEGAASSATHQTVGRWEVFGLLWGLIGLSNPSLFLFLPACVAWMLWGLRGDRAALVRAGAKAVLAAVIAAACLAPWVGRNERTLHAFVPARSNFGVEFWQSTLAVNEGLPWGTAMPLAETHPEFVRYKAIGEVAYAREKQAEALRNVRAHPGRILNWTVRRVYFFWASVPKPFEGKPAAEIVRELDFGFLSLAGLLGLALAIRRRVPGSWLFASAFLLIPSIYYLVTVQARFRHPLEPLIAVLGVYLFRSADRGARRDVS